MNLPVIIKDQMNLAVIFKDLTMIESVNFGFYPYTDVC